MPYGQEIISRRTDGVARAEESLLSFGRVVTEEDDSQITEITENLCDMNNR